MSIKAFFTVVLFSFGMSSSAVRVFAFAETAADSNANTTVLEVDGVKVTNAEFEQKRPGSVFQARNAFYEAERKSIDDYVDEYLLEREAKKENLTAAQMVEKHVTSMLPPDPSDDALRVYYEAVDTPLPFEAVRAQILDHIKQIRIAKAKAAYVKSLRAQAKVVITLNAPRATVSLKDTPIRGAVDAPVMIVEYSDYECPYCQQTQPALDKIEAEFKGKIAFAYKDTPLPMHSHAQKAAEASHCAGVQGKYWEYHDYLFAHKQLEIAQLKEAARTLNLDSKSFDECLDSGAQAATVRAQSADGAALQLQGTPSFLINGRFINGGLGYDQFRSLIEEELKAAPAGVKQAARE
jgi:protein-disulfide isomerase